MKTIKFIVLEDDPKFRNELITELNSTEGCEVIGASDNVSEGYEKSYALNRMHSFLTSNSLVEQLSIWCA